LVPLREIASVGWMDSLMSFALRVRNIRFKDES
jgi:hypothetical protein